MDRINYTKEDFNRFWKNLLYLGTGSEGVCKRLNKREIMKYLNGPDNRNLSEEDILKYKNIEQKTYIFAHKVFYIDDVLSGYITRYSKGKNLIEINRDKILFDKIINGCKIVEEDTKILSDSGIKTCDILFNILYQNGVFNIIDTCEYNNSDIQSDLLYKKNISIFNYSILEFLIKDRFYRFVFSSNELSKYYDSVENGESIVPFLKLLKQRLSEYCDKEVKTVESAGKAISLCHKSIYPQYF
ncbi:MAG: hypothetical protein J6J17_00085 [Bacilli bacterium]|nr:hypothetical protein [Bacilli bacterium]